MCIRKCTKNLNKVINVAEFGEKLVSYEQSSVLQQKLAELCKTSSIPDTLLQLQASSFGTSICNLM
jgi:hypothetical protein